MRTRQEIALSELHARLRSTLQRVRSARSHEDLNADFYIALGLISAASILAAIDIAASDRLHDLALNASKQRSDELTTIARLERKAAQLRAAA